MLGRGDRFDRYVIEEQLGEGGMARVYCAHDPRLNRHVALKVLLDSSADPSAVAGARSRVLREARAAAAIDHPNLVSVFDVGEADGELFIAMELVVGKSLRAYVGDDGVPWETKLRWMLDAARALGAAHERGLVHRDVKPENVMVRSDGVVKVLDFGIAKRTPVDIQGSSAAMDETGQSLAGTLAGTPSYLSPEQLRGDVVDGRADQFAWGVTTYELLTGRLPWPREAEGFKLVLAILNHAPEPPSKIVADVPSIVDATILKALAKTPSQRFEAIEFVVSTLEGVSGSRSRDVARIGSSKTDPAPAMPDAQQAHTPPDARPRSAPVLRRSMALGLVAVAAAIGVVFASTRFTRVHPIAATAPSTHAAPAPTAMTDLPDPPTGDAQARAAFRGYLKAFRDADWDAAMRSLDQTIARDSAHGAAHLRLAFMHSLYSADEAQVRTSFKNAVRHSAAMSEHDAAILDALEPYLQREPSEPLEAERRLEAARARFPLDAEIAYLLGSVRYDRGDLAKALEAFDAGIAIDPAFAQAWSSKGGCLAYMGRFDDAHASLARALESSRSATEPLWYQAEIDEQQGHCAAEESTVREWLGRDPEDWYGYDWLARALEGEGKPIDSVRTAFEQKWLRLSGDRKAKLEAVDRATLDLLSGDFVAAQRRLEEMEVSLALEPVALAHAKSHWLLTSIAEETGSTKQARAVAESYLARRDAWAAPHRVDDRTIWEDPVPQMLGVLARAGAISSPQWSERRDEWLRTWRAKTSDTYAPYLWIFGWAAPVSARADAEAAIAALPAYSPLPPFVPMTIAPAHVGHAYLLAGKLDEAVAHLRAGVASCGGVGDPIAQTRASLWFGQALEAKGDGRGACAAYRAVLDRWGSAKPRSITADRARARIAALACR